MSIQSCRDFYAQIVVRSAGSTSDALIAAFSSVERERYVGKGPWSIFVGGSYIQTPSDDPRLLYQDVLVGLAPERGINNGQPSLHARCLAACAPRQGDSIVHIGAGTGYYTAILSLLTGPRGSVVSYEVDPDLAARAKLNLAHLSNVHLMALSATDGALPSADVIYVNAGATHPPAAWLAALNLGGRLIFPLTASDDAGCMLMVTRQGDTHYAANLFARAAFIPCIGARDDATATRLRAALESQSFKGVKSLRLGTPPDASAWCVGHDWWLSTDEPR